MSECQRPSNVIKLLPASPMSGAKSCDAALSLVLQPAAFHRDPVAVRLIRNQGHFTKRGFEFTKLRAHCFSRLGFIRREIGTNSA